ncbi:biofilm formation regulator BssR [Shigella sonnei]
MLNCVIDTHVDLAAYVQLRKAKRIRVVRQRKQSSTR